MDQPSITLIATAIGVVITSAVSYYIYRRQKTIYEKWGLKVESKEGVLSILKDIKAKIIKTDAFTSAQLTLLNENIEVVFGRQNIMKYMEKWIENAYEEEIFGCLRVGNYPQSLYDSLEKAFKRNCSLRVLCDLNNMGKDFVEKVDKILRSLGMPPSKDPNSLFKVKNCVIKNTRIIGIGMEKIGISLSILPRPDKDYIGIFIAHSDSAITLKQAFERIWENPKKNYENLFGNATQSIIKRTE